jgi:transcriptional antiterminator Rof (Rho-off)
MKKYQAWIEKHYSTPEQAKYKCYQACSAMNKKFPELKIVRGHVVLACQWHQHWWLETKTGEIIDPTAIQFTKIKTYKKLSEDELWVIEQMEMKPKPKLNKRSLLKK